MIHLYREDSPEEAKWPVVSADPYALVGIDSWVFGLCDLLLQDAENEKKENQDSSCQENNPE